MKALKILLLLILLFVFCYQLIADELEDHYEKEAMKPKQTFEEIVADTFTFDEFAEWTATRQRFEAKENKDKEQQLDCVAKGKKVKTCVDPHWCLYPSNFDKDECTWYRIKYSL